MQSEVAPEARWLVGDERAARDVAATLTLAAQKNFAVEALAACCQVADDVPLPIRQVVDVGREAPRRAHAAFSAVRELTLESEAREERASPRRNLLYVAENAAKVIYNATGPDDPFDLDSAVGLLCAIAVFHEVLPAARRNTLSEQLLATLSEIKAATENAKHVIDPELFRRWLLGDTQATQALAARMNTTQLPRLGSKILTACLATLVAPPSTIPLVVDAIEDRGGDLEEVAALAASERAQSLPTSQEARLWSIAEQAVSAARDARVGAKTLDANHGYYLLLATARFYSSVGEQHRGPLHRILVAASDAARS